MDSNHSIPWGAATLVATAEHIAHRAEVTPGLTAARYAGGSATYRDFADAFAEYDGVARNQGMSLNSAVIAAVLHCIPQVCDGDPASTAAAVHDIVVWLGRDIDEPGIDDTGYGGLRAVS